SGGPYVDGWARSVECPARRSRRSPTADPGQHPAGRVPGGVSSAPPGGVLMAITRIDATRLIPGGGDPIPNGTVVIDGPRIAYAGAAAGAPDVAADVVLTVETVMPGMWDTHTHFMGLARGVVKLDAVPNPITPTGTLRDAHNEHAAL